MTTAISMHSFGHNTVGLSVALPFFLAGAKLTSWGATITNEAPRPPIIPHQIRAPPASLCPYCPIPSGAGLLRDVFLFLSSGKACVVFDGVRKAALTFINLIFTTFTNVCASTSSQAPRTKRECSLKSILALLGSNGKAPKRPQLATEIKSSLCMHVWQFMVP